MLSLHLICLSRHLRNFLQRMSSFSLLNPQTVQRKTKNHSSKPATVAWQRNDSHCSHCHRQREASIMYKAKTCSLKIQFIILTLNVIVEERQVTEDLIHSLTSLKCSIYLVPSKEKQNKTKLLPLKTKHVTKSRSKARLVNCKKITCFKA